MALVRVLQAVAVDEAEVVPEVELEVRVRHVAVRHAAQHLAERALERLPVLLRGEDLVDALERLEVRGVEIERLAEELDRAVLVAFLVAIELRHRVEELALARPASFSLSAMACSVSIIFDQFSVA